MASCCFQTVNSLDGRRFSNKKSFSYPAGAGMVAFALSGDASYARTAIDDSCEALQSLQPEDHNLKGMRRAIRGTIKRVLRDYDEAGLDAGQKPEFIVAVGTHAEGLRMYYARNSAMPLVEHYQFSGSGAYLAHYIMNAFGPGSQVSIRETVPVAIHILNATKSHDAGVGGGSQFIALRAFVTKECQSQAISSTGLFQLKFNPKESEHISNYEQWCGGLLSSIGDPSLSDEEIDKRLAIFRNHMLEIRRTINEPGTAYRGLIDHLSQTKRGTNSLSQP